MADSSCCEGDGVIGHVVVVTGCLVLVVVKKAGTVARIVGRSIVTVVKFGINVGYAVKEAHWWRDKVAVLFLILPTGDSTLSNFHQIEHLVLCSSPE